MKRKVVSVVGVLVLACTLLPGCTHELSATNANGSDVQSEIVSVSQPPFEAKIDWVWPMPVQWPRLEKTTNAEPDVLTLEEIIEAFSGDEEDFPAGYDYYHCDNRIWVTVDDEDYCIDAVYPSDEWTPAEIVASYRNHSAPWVDGWFSDDCLWSPDYEHKFTVSWHHNNSAGHGDEWLYIDGYRAWPTECPVGDISPGNIIRLYQSGEWDGSERIYSDECPAIVLEGIKYDGTLDYCYDVKDMTKEDIEAAEELIRSWEHVYLNDYGHSQLSCDVFIYPDSPDPYNLRFAETRCNSEGTYFSYLEYDSSKDWANCTGARVELCKQGELMQSWNLTPEKEYWASDRARLIYKRGECYFFHYDTLWRLLPDGGIELILDDIVDYDYFWDSVYQVFYTKSGEVAFIPPLSDEELEERLNRE